MGVYTINQLAVIGLRSIIFFYFYFLHKVPSGNHKDVTKTKKLHFLNALYINALA